MHVHSWPLSRPSVPRLPLSFNLPTLRPWVSSLASIWSSRREAFASLELVCLPAEVILYTIIILLQVLAQIRRGKDITLRLSGYPCTPSTSGLTSSRNGCRVGWEVAGYDRERVVVRDLERVASRTREGGS